MTDRIDAPGMEDWLLREDAALKEHLKGLVVSDANRNPRPVGVWFGQPEQEIRTQSYPYLTIDLIDIAEDKSRVHNRYGPLYHAHPGFPVSDNEQIVRSMFPTPMDIYYQVTSWARHPRHDRSILQQMNFRYLHPRFAQVRAGDDTARRLEVHEYAKRDTLDENQKRLFRNVWTVCLKSEFFYWTLDLTPRVTSVNIETAPLPQ